MELQRSGYNLKIALAVALAALVVASDGYLIVYLTIAGHFPDFWSLEALYIAISALFPALVTFGACFNVRAVILRRRQAQALAARDPANVAETIPQPDAALALGSGETLTLTRRYSLNAIFRTLVAILYLPGMIYLGEALIFLLLPSFGQSSLNPLYNRRLDGPPASQPTVFDWLAAALLLLFVVAAFGVIAWQALRDRVSQVSADDTGITVRNGCGRHRIAWDEIELFARLLETPKDAPLGSYAIWGHLRSVSFSIPGVEQATDYEPGEGTREAGYVFSGGYNHYTRDAQRLLATIVTRAQTPLLVMRIAPYLGHQSKNPIATMSEESALALPLASPLYTPSGDPVGATLDEGERISLQAHSRPMAVTGSWITDLSPAIAIVWSISWVIRLLSIEWLAIFLIVAITIPLLALYVILFRRQQIHSHLPDVSADETGITTWGSAKSQPVQIPWQRVTAWVVVPPKRGTIRPFRYVVLGDGLRIGWVEPTYGQYTWQSASSPHGGYRKQAERLHALIAARTGLPLRELHLD